MRPSALRNGILEIREPPELAAKRPFLHQDKPAFSERRIEDLVEMRVPDRTYGERRRAEDTDSGRGPHPRSIADREDRETADLANALLELQDVGHRRALTSPGGVKTWSQFEISPEIALSVLRDIGKGVELLVRVRRNLQQLIARRSRQRRE